MMGFFLNFLNFFLFFGHLLKPLIDSRDFLNKIGSLSPDPVFWFHLHCTNFIKAQQTKKCCARNDKWFAFKISILFVQNGDCGKCQGGGGGGVSSLTIVRVVHRDAL
jgi:hypothetical protein